MLSQLTVVEKERLLKLARSLRVESKTVTLPPISVVDRREYLPLSFAQQRLWFMAQQMGVSEAYYISYRLRLKGQLTGRPCRGHWIGLWRGMRLCETRSFRWKASLHSASRRWRKAGSTWRSTICASGWGRLRNWII